MRKFLSGFTCFLGGLLLIPLGAYVYLRFGHPPVAVSDAPFPMEKTIVHMPLNARIQREAPANSPLAATPSALTAGATVYRQQCGFCHGLPNQPSATGPHMYPSAPQLWVAHRRGVVGVSDDPVGETFWKVKNGIRLTGMPSYERMLSSDEMWQVSLLLSVADKPLPPPAQQELAAAQRK